jgi:hypothetical protein
MTAIHASTSLEQRAIMLKRLLHGRAELDVAQFRFVGLERLPQHEGRAWARRRDLLWQIAEIYMLNRIEEADILIRGPEYFLVMFADRSGARAEFAAQCLAEGATDRFQGLTDGPSPELVADTFSLPAPSVAKILREHGATSGTAAPARAAPSLMEADWLFRPTLVQHGKS